jgi:tRNA nucleotidyltransferase (CCA-adding enzyme)
MTRKILTDLKFDNKTIEQVSILVYEHMTRFDKKPKDTALKKLINRVGRENLENLFELQKADILASAPPYDLDLINYVKNRCQDIIITKQPLTVKDLAVSGNDIMSLGIPQGAVIGEILKHMLEIVLENPDFNNKEYLMKFVKEGNFYVK